MGEPKRHTAYQFLCQTKHFASWPRSLTRARVTRLIVSNTTRDTTLRRLLCAKSAHKEAKSGR
jgi:hypothetical protein